MVKYSARTPLEMALAERRSVKTTVDWRLIFDESDDESEQEFKSGMTPRGKKSPFKARAKSPRALKQPLAQIRRKKRQRMRRNPKPKYYLTMQDAKHRVLNSMRRNKIPDPSDKLRKFAGDAADWIKSAFSSFATASSMFPAWVTRGALESMEMQIRDLKKRVDRLEKRPPAPAPTPRCSPPTQNQRPEFKSPMPPPRRNPLASRLPSAAALQGVQLRSLTKSAAKGKPPRRPPSPFAFTAASLGAAKNRLAKRSAEPKQKPKSTGSSGGGITMDQLLSVKLRKASKTPIPKRKQTGGLCMQDITNVRLRKTALPRSPGGTPCKSRKKRRADDENRSPSNARCQGEFLRLALRRKFANTKSIAMTPLPQETSTWSVLETPATN